MSIFVRWRPDATVTDDLDGALISNAVGASFVRGRSIFPIVDWLAQQTVEPQLLSGLVAAMPEGRAAAFEELVRTLKGAGALNIVSDTAQLAPSAGSRLERGTGLRHVLPRIILLSEPENAVSHFLAQTFALFGIEVTTGEAHADTAEFGGTSIQIDWAPTPETRIVSNEAGSAARRHFHHVALIGHRLWWLRPGTDLPAPTADDLLHRMGGADRTATGIDVSRLQAAVYQLCQSILVASLSTQEPGMAAVRSFDLLTLEPTDRTLVRRSGTTDPETIEHHDQAIAEVSDVEFSRRAACIADDVIGPIGVPSESGLEQGPLQVSRVLVRDGRAIPTRAYGYGATLEAARVAAARLALLVHGFGPGVPAVASPRTPRTPRAGGVMRSDTARVSLDWVFLDEELGSRFGTERDLSEVPAGLAHGTSWISATAAAARSLELGRMLRTAQLHGLRTEARRTVHEALLRTLDNRQVVTWHLTNTPFHVCAVQVAAEHAVYAEGANAEDAEDAALLLALAWHQSSKGDNQGMRPQGWALPDDTNVAPRHPDWFSDVSWVSRYGEIAYFTLTQDPALAEIFPFRIAAVYL
ncbi:hypothetical protein [Cryobacterium sp. N21]|uniref:hypothetical protein n=1 Tax=Cryobacterium sp. N21 TaxID=2048289 RepID=UPI001125169D|nr:hypothetical protein [Cryobacterium sp. N21]